MSAKRLCSREALPGLHQKALDDFSKGLLTKQQLLAVIHRLDRIAFIHERY